MGWPINATDILSPPVGFLSMLHSPFFNFYADVRCIDGVVTIEFTQVPGSNVAVVSLGRPFDSWSRHSEHGRVYEIAHHCP